MMIRVLFLSAFLMSEFLCVAQATAGYCELYFPTKEGTAMEYSNYNPKGKIESKTRHTVLSKSESENNLTVAAKGESMDKKGKVVSEHTFKVKCQNGAFMIDMSAIGFNNESLNDNYETQMAIHSDDLEIPANPKVGDKLAGGSLTVTLGSGAGSPGLNLLRMDVLERSVVSLEKITTPAGTFDCVKISYTIICKLGPIKVQTRSVDWYSKNIGMVRQEIYKKNGKMWSYSELTKMK